MPPFGRRPLLIAFVAIVAIVAAGIAWTRAIVRRIEAETPPRGTFVTIYGARLHVLRRDPVGPAHTDVLLIHGASGNALDMMEALGDRLAERGFRVWAADRPGHGWSDRPPDAASPARQARMLRAALASLGVSQAIVLGHSLGGAIADNIAIEHPDFAAGVVLVSPVTHEWPGGIRWYYSAASLRPIGRMFASVVALPVGLAMLDAAVAAVFAPQAPPPDYVNRTGARLVLRPSEFVANAQDVAALKAFVRDQAPREATVRVPVAIVAGDDTDTIVSTRIHAVASARAIPGATLRILPGIGHAPHWAAPEAIVAAIEDVSSRAGREDRPAAE